MKHTIFRLSGYFFLVLALSVTAAQSNDDTESDVAKIEAAAARDYIAQPDNAVI